MPNLPRLIARPAGAAPRASGEHFGGGRGLDQLGSAIQGVAQVAEHITESELAQRTNRAAAEAAAELAEYADELAQDPDHATAHERFEKRRKEVLQRKKAEVGNRRFAEALDDKLFPVSERLGASVRITVRKKQIDSIVADLDRSEQIYANLTARAKTPDEHDQYRTLYMASLRDSVSAGAITERDVVSRMQAFDQQVLDSLALEGLRVDPARLLSELNDPGGPFADMPEDRRQWRISQATEAARIRESAVKTAQEEALRERFDELTRRAYEDPEFGVADLPEDLGSKERRIIMGILKGRAGGEGALFDASYYDELLKLKRRDPDAFASEPLDHMRLGNTVYRELRQEQDAVRTSVAGTGRTFIDRVRARLDEVDPDELIAPEFRGLFTRAAEEEYQRRSAGGKRLTASEENEIIAQKAHEYLSQAIRKPKGVTTQTGITYQERINAIVKAYNDNAWWDLSADDAINLSNAAEYALERYETAMGRHATRREEQIIVRSARDLKVRYNGDEIPLYKVPIGAGYTVGGFSDDVVEAAIMKVVSRGVPVNKESVLNEIHEATAMLRSRGVDPSTENINSRLEPAR